MTYLVEVEQDWDFWTVEYATKFRWVAAIVVRWNTRANGKWSNRNVRVRP